MPKTKFFKREAQNVGERVERLGNEGGEGRSELAHFLGREQRDSGGRIQHVGAGAFQ